MEKHELKPLINELCYLSVLRNKINTRRHRARFRKNYYTHAIRVVEAHNNSNYEIRNLRNRLDLLKIEDSDDVHEAARLNEKISNIEKTMSLLTLRNPNPKKWKTMGLHKLRSLVLQSYGDYAYAKHETMEFTIKNRTRVKFLSDKLNCILNYENGSIKSIVFKDKPDSASLYDADIVSNAEQYELNNAIETMVEE